jgi:hypothetical protein
MIGKFLDERITYTGRELTSHWAFRRFNLLGDSIVAFVGPCDVPIDRMADLEDVKSNAPIRSDEMLHFIVEHFGDELETTVLRQRLLICLMAEQLHTAAGGKEIVRRGDDLYRGDEKLSVSIAVKSPVSCMIHAGLNVVRRGTPVKAVGLTDLGVDPRPFGEEVIGRYLEECEGIFMARCKVRGVS